MRTRTYMPSPERIKEECAKIRATWSKEECAKRWVRRSVTHLAIRVVDTRLVSSYLLEEGMREIYNWQYAMDEQRKEKPAVTQSLEVEESFEPTTVSFG